MNSLLFLLGACTPHQEPMQEPKSAPPPVPVVTQEVAMASPVLQDVSLLRLTVVVPTSCTRGEGCPIQVTLFNPTSQPVRINPRLAMGYKHHFARELYGELLLAASMTPADYPPTDYDREFLAPDQYVLLAANASVSKTLNLFDWMQPTQPGEYLLRLYYEAHEALAKAPEDTAKGVAVSETVHLTVR